MAGSPTSTCNGTSPTLAAFLSRLASFSRLITFDKRGTGLSDRVAINALPTLEERMDDLRAVMDSAGSEKASLLGVSESGAMCLLFAATYPKQCSFRAHVRQLREAHSLG
jgi:pimeloyl-ACP methyl ester carboxylesterase